MEKKLQQTNFNIKKVAFVGAESTGKTTISKALAEHFNTLYCPEFMRDFLQQKWDKTKEICTFEDLKTISEGQISSENHFSEMVFQQKNIKNKILFCDTNIFELMVYSYIYFDKCDENIELMAKKHTYDLVFLTNIDVPWEKDDLRDRPNDREEILNKFKYFLTKNSVDFIFLEGNKTQRLEFCIEKCNRILTIN